MIIRGGTVVTDRGVEKADIAIAGDQIVAVGLNLAGDGEEIDATGLHVFPGGIDSHVHFNEPGRTEWEDIAHGSAALAAGGYTTFIDMPLNNLPVTTDVAAFDLKLEAMKRSSKVDFGLWGGLVPGNLNQLEPLVQRGVMGFKAFMCSSGIDEFPAANQRTLREGMKRIAALGSILLVHAEDPSRLLEPKGSSAMDFIRSRPHVAERAAIAQAIELADATGCRLHVVHVTPPFRTASDRRALWTAEMIVSDHSPSTLDLKSGDDFTKIWGGISGCQSTRQLLLAQDRLDLPEVAAVTATNIARRFGLEGKGDIATAFDADLWIVDLSGADIVRREDLLYRNAFSAHEGQRIRGRTIKTLVGGAEPGSGRFIRPQGPPRNQGAAYDFVG